MFEIDVRDEKFRNFLNLFKDYQDQLGKMSGFWNEAGAAAAGAEGSTSSMVETLAAGAASTALISDAMSRAESSSQRTSSTFATIADRAKSIAGFIEHATLRLAKWSVLSLGAGLVGGGVGLFGLDRLGEGIAGTRRAAQSLGISSGELNAFNINYGQRLGLGADFLGGIQDIKSDLGQSWRFAPLGISAEEVRGSDTAQLTVRVIQRMHDLWRQAGAAGHNKQWMEAHGLDPSTFGQWQQIGLQSQGDLNSWAAQYQHDARTMSVSDPIQKQWIAFSTQLERAGKQIEIALVDGLEPLIKSDALQKLSASIVTLVDKFFANNNVVAGIDHLAEGISKLGDYLGSEKFQSDMKKFVDGTAYAAEKIVAALRFLHLIPQETATGTEQYGPGSDEATANLPSTQRSLSGWSSWPNLFKSGPDFGPLSQAAGLPPGMMGALADQESGGRSHPEDQFAAGEWHQGMFQMSESMQKEWGVTDPYNAEQESKGTARAESAYLQRFHGNVAQAIAAWYEGPTGVQRKIDEANAKHTDWWSVESPAVKKYVESVASKMHVDVRVLNQTGANVAVTANATRQ